MIEPTFIEAYGRTITDYTNASRRNLNVKGLSSLDFRTPKANGAPWDFRRRSDRQAAIKLVDDLNPDWILGAPPCTAFSIWNFGMNYKKMDGDAVRAKLAEGRLHLKFACRLYRRQIKKGKFFLHEHPASALSWSEDSIKQLCGLPSTFTVTADQCQYGLVTPSAKDKDVMLPALKP